MRVFWNAHPAYVPVAPDRAVRVTTRVFDRTDVEGRIRPADS
jgi:hypothetical protein